MTTTELHAAIAQMQVLMREAADVIERNASSINGIIEDADLVANLRAAALPWDQWHKKPEPTDSMGMPISCGKPLCSPGDHHPLCKLAEQPAPAQQEQRYSIDKDPSGIRAAVCDAVIGALAFGAQGANPPPAGHWLNQFWQMARSEREQQAPVQQEPVAWAVYWGHRLERKNSVHFDRKTADAVASEIVSFQTEVRPLYTLPQPTTEDSSVAEHPGVFVPLEVLEAAEDSLGSFISDQGWSEEDMQNMDNLSAYIARHKAANTPSEGA